ncbi:MAG: serine hydrolase domain-containing protein [Dermatophilus congolensis]|nr:serine hydrolase domain-containing protein [Dermatophilus congolensis]
MSETHAHRAEAVVAAVREANRALAVPGVTWAVASGVGEKRQVTVGAEGVAEDSLMLISSVTKVIASAATFALIEAGVLGLDDPVERWVPEWGGRRVLARRHGPLSETVPAARSTTVRDLLMMGFGLGWDMSAPDDDPLTLATAAAGITSTWQVPSLSPSEWAHQAASLPMAHQPGDGYMYHFSFDALTVVVEAATGQSFDEVLRERIFDPLGMRDTGYVVPASELPRVLAQYFPGDDGAERVAPDADPSLLQRPDFCSASTGLVSTASDLITFGQMLLDNGMGPQRRVLPEEAVRLMRADSLSAPAREMAEGFLDPGLGWGVGAAVDDQGRFGWDGGTGTSLWIDPTAGVAAVILTRGGMGSPDSADCFTDFWNAVRAQPW